MSSSVNDQLEAWEELASNLEQKIIAREDENARLKERLGRKDVEYGKLQEELKQSSTKITSLEARCLEQSTKINELSEIITTKKPNELKKKLKEKSLQSAEHFSQMKSWRSQFKKSETERDRIRRHCESLEKENLEISEKLATTSSALEKLQKDRERNNKLLRDMSDIIRSLNCVTISYEKEAVEVIESTAHAHEQAVNNIKRKIQAMELHRHQLIEECQQLRSENAVKDEKIRALESYYHSVNDSVNESDSSSVNSTSGYPEPFETIDDFMSSSVKLRKSDQANSRFSHPDNTNDVDVDDTVSCASSESSFSTLIPPEVSIEKYEMVKKDYEESLKRILSLTEELEEAQSKLDMLEQVTLERDKSIEKYKNLQNENKEVRQRIVEIESELSDAKSNYEAFKLQAKAHESRHQAKIVKADQEYQLLQEKFDAAQSEFFSQLDAIESEVDSSREAFNKRCENMKKDHANELEALAQQFADYKAKHSLGTDTQKKRYDDLYTDYEASIEKYDALEVEFKALNKKYDESLTRIVSLEEHSLGIDTQKKRYDDLYTDYEALIKKYDALEVEFKALNKKYNESLTRIVSLEEHSLGIDTQKKRYDDLYTDYEASIEKYDALEVEFKALNKKYDESLARIVSLEDLLEKAKQKCMKSSSDLKRAQDEQTSVIIAEMKQSADKSRTAMQEAVMKYQKLKQESQATITKYEKELEELRKLKEKVRAVESEQKERESDVPSKSDYDQLSKSYKSALSKIDMLGSRLSEAGIPLEEGAKRNNRVSHGTLLPRKHLTTLEKISSLEKALDDDDEQSCTSGVLQQDDAKSSVKEGFERDYEAIVLRIANRKPQTSCKENPRVKNTNKKAIPSECTRMDESWFYQLYHQAKLRYVHDSLDDRHKSSSSETIDGVRSNQVFFEKSAFDQGCLEVIKHNQILQSVHRTMLEKNSSEISLMPLPEEITFQSSSTDAESSDPDLFCSDFLLHNRKLQAVHRTLANFPWFEALYATCEDPFWLDEVLVKDIKHHMKRLENVQTELLERRTPTRKSIKDMVTNMLLRRKQFHQIHQGLETNHHSKKTGFDSGTVIYEFLIHHVQLNIVHIDLINKVEKCENINALDCGGLPDSSSLTRLIYSPDTCSDGQSFDNNHNHQNSAFLFEDDGSSTVTTKTAQKVATARLVIDGLRFELRRVKLAANAARIRQRAREKDLRVVQFQYEKLQQEYKTTVAAEEPSGKSATLAIPGTRPVFQVQLQAPSMAVDPRKGKPSSSPLSGWISDDGSVQTQKSTFSKGTTTTRTVSSAVSKEDLKKAELKLKKTTRDVAWTRALADEAEKKREYQEKHLENVIKRFHTLEAESVASMMNNDTKSDGNKNVTMNANGQSKLENKVFENQPTTILSAKDDSMSFQNIERSTKNDIFRRSGPLFDTAENQAAAAGDMIRNNDFQGNNTFVTGSRPGYSSGEVLLSRNGFNSGGIHEQCVVVGSTVQVLPSFDGSHLTSVYDPGMSPQRNGNLNGSNVDDSFAMLDNSQQQQQQSPEGRDEKGTSGNNNNNSATQSSSSSSATSRQIEIVDATLRLEYDAAMQRLADMQRELDTAKRDTLRAKKKQAARESNLRDVIYQYKKLKSEYDDLSKQLNGEGEDNDDENDNDMGGDNTKNGVMGANIFISKLKKELEETKTKLSIVQADLKAAEEASLDTRQKLLERDGYLRQLVEEYKKLKAEHAAALRSLENLKKELVNRRDSPRRQQHHQQQFNSPKKSSSLSDDDVRDTKLLTDEASPIPKRYNGQQQRQGNPVLLSPLNRRKKLFSPNNNNNNNNNHRHLHLLNNNNNKEDARSVSSQKSKSDNQPKRKFLGLRLGRRNGNINSPTK